MINIEKVLFFSNRDHVNAPRVGQTWPRTLNDRGLRTTPNSYQDSAIIYYMLKNLKYK